MSIINNRGKGDIMGASSNVLKARADKVIEKLENPPENIECKAHGPMSEGILLLLEFKREELNTPSVSKNQIRIGNCTVTGTAAIAVCGAIYAVMKVHGAI